MTHPGLIILYINDPATSVAYYRDLFGIAPVEEHPDFAMFKLDTGLMFGLWRRVHVTPPAQAPAGGAELVITATLEEDARLHAAWAARGIAILAPPADAEFGRSFVAADPDGHRLRVLAPS